MLRRLPLVALLVVFTLLSACSGGGDGATAVPDNTPATITLNPAGAATFASGTSITVSPSVLTRDNRAVAAAVSWASSDAAIATVSNGTITGVKVGTATITATAGSASASITATVTPGTPAQLIVRTHPIGATIGALLTTQPVVEVRDAAGNLVTSSTATVTAAIGTGGGTLGGTIAVPAVGGVATFQSLTVSGTVGDRTLTFNSPGLTPAISSTFTMTAPPVPVIAVDSVSVALSTTAGTNPAPATVRITNAGSAPFTSLGVSVAYDSAQPAGWLTAAFSGTTVPTTLTLTATSASLAAGTYNAFVRLVAPGATNSPLTIPVTLTVSSAAALEYGSPAEKVGVIDVGGSVSPAVTINGKSPSASGFTASFASRATSIATVDASGKITARAPGDVWIVGTTNVGTTDSVFVTVPRQAGAPVIRATNTTWVERAFDTTVVNVVLDTRGTVVGAASLAVGIQLVPGVWSSVTYTVAAGPPVPVVGNLTRDVLRVAVGTAQGMTGQVSLLTLKLVGPTPGLSGWITLLALDVSGIDGSDLTPITTSTRLPLVVR